MLTTRTVEELMDNAAKREKPKNNGKISERKDSPARRAQKLAARVKLRKAPRQERSKVMVEAILEGAAQVFAELGYGRATTNKIAERAGGGVSQGVDLEQASARIALAESNLLTEMTNLHDVH